MASLESARLMRLSMKSRMAGAGSHRRECADLEGFMVGAVGFEPTTSTDP